MKCGSPPRSGFAIDVFVRTLDELRALVDARPFASFPARDDVRHNVVFVRRVPTGLGIPMATPKGDVEIIGHGAAALFVLWRLIGGRPPNPGPFLEQLTGATTTSRFFDTLVKIVTAASSG